MALTIGEIIRAILPNIGVVLNADAATYRVGVEDVNSDEILAALVASGVDLAALEVLITAGNVDLAAIEVLNTAILAAFGAVTVASTTITKTIQTELLAITLVAADAQQLSSELALTNMKKVAILIDHGRTATTAFVVAGTEYRVEVSQKATGNDTWRTIASAVCGIAAATAITADGDEAAGQTLIEIGANTPVVNDIVFWEHTTLANSEWMKVVAITGGTDFTIQDALTNAQLAAQLIYNKGEQFVLLLDVEAYTRLRVVVNNNNGTTNAQVASRVAAITQV